MSWIAKAKERNCGAHTHTQITKRIFIYLNLLRWSLDWFKNRRKQSHKHCKCRTANWTKQTKSNHRNGQSAGHFNVFLFWFYSIEPTIKSANIFVCIQCFRPIPLERGIVLHFVMASSNHNNGINTIWRCFIWPVDFFSGLKTNARCRYLFLSHGDFSLWMCKYAWNLDSIL